MYVVAYVCCLMPRSRQCIFMHDLAFPTAKINSTTTVILVWKNSIKNNRQQVKRRDVFCLCYGKRRTLPHVMKEKSPSPIAGVVTLMSQTSLEPVVMPQVRRSLYTVQVLLKTNKESEVDQRKGCTSKARVLHIGKAARKFYKRSYTLDINRW